MIVGAVLGIALEARNSSVNMYAADTRGDAMPPFEGRNRLNMYDAD